jgi:ribosomal subunit interface protein
MDITFKGRHTSVPERFRRHAVAKLAKLEKLDQKAFRIDVQVSTERNPRQADHSERIELTIRSRGPAIRAEATSDDRYVALDLALAKLEARLRRAAERRKVRHGDLTVRSADVLAAVGAPDGADGAPMADAAAGPDDDAVPRAPRGRGGTRSGPGRVNGRGKNGRPQFVVPLPETAAAAVAVAEAPGADGSAGRPSGQADPSGLVPIQMEGDGPLIVREKFHASGPMTLDQALLEMELVGHDFFAYQDKDCGRFSVVYRRRGYDYGVIRLVEELSKGRSFSAGTWGGDRLPRAPGGPRRRDPGAARTIRVTCPILCVNCECSGRSGRDRSVQGGLGRSRDDGSREIACRFRRAGAGGVGQRGGAGRRTYPRAHRRRPCAVSARPGDGAGRGGWHPARRTGF